jgi:prepilin-type processing-associated H-X9-DG protein
MQPASSRTDVAARRGVRRRRRIVEVARHPRRSRVTWFVLNAQRRRAPARRACSFVDLMVVLALVPMLALAVLSCADKRRDTNARVRCASNLRQIGQAILLYANENKGALPRTIASTGPAVTPVWGSGAASTQPFGELGPAPNDVTAALFLLMRTQDIGSEVFTCPSSAAEKWDFGGGANTAMNWSNWNGHEGVRKHLSYSYVNLYPDDAAARTGFDALVAFDRTRGFGASADFALASDKNPGVGRGAVNVLTVTTTSSAADMKHANSLNHDGDGQNVLYIDGHVEFQQNPFVGVRRDNIFTRRASSTGFASAPGALAQPPYDADDSVLLPAEE